MKVWFLALGFWMIHKGQKKILKQKVAQKICGLFPCVPILGVFLIKKCATRWGVCVVALKAHCYLWKVYYYYEEVL